MSDTKSDTPKDLLTAEDAEALLASDDLATVEIFVPEWKKTVRLRQLTAAEGIQVADGPARQGMLMIVALSVVDAAGNRIFKDSERLKGKSAGALGRIQEAALKLNGFSANVVAAAKNA